MLDFPLLLLEDLLAFLSVSCVCYAAGVETAWKGLASVLHQQAHAYYSQRSPVVYKRLLRILLEWDLCIPDM